MNGAHDLGGMQGLGRVEREENEPVFHSAWEKTVFGLLFGTVGNGLINLDEFRHGIERMNPVHYLASRYYEHWLYTIERNLVEKGIINEADLKARMRQFSAKSGARPKRTKNPELAKRMLGMIRRGGSTRMEINQPPRFKVGDRVITRNINPTGHTRLPRYARAKHGEIERVYDSFVFPDTSAHQRGPNPQYVYSVRFDGRELWGREAEPNAFVYIDMWEDYIEPV